MTRIPLLFSILLLTVSGCDIPELTTVIDTQIPPVIIEASLSPSTVDFGKLSSEGTTHSIALVGYVNTKDDNGLEDISSVTYTLFSPNGSFFVSGNLLDDGVFPDAQRGDGKYQSTINLKLPKQVIGTYNVQYTTTDKKGFTSNTFNLPLNIILSTNAAPSISNLKAPDTVRVPLTSDSVNMVSITLDVSDPDGLSDITSVILTSQRPDSTVAGTFFLYDDGGTVVHSQFGITSGDTHAGDGRYSIVIPIFHTAQKNTYRDFIFTARDQSGVFSNVISKRVHIQ